MIETIKTSDEFRAGRHKLGLSVSQCSTLIFVRPETVRRWETGARPPHPSACRILELALGGFIEPEILKRLIAGKGMP